MCGVSAILKFRGRVVREDLARMSSAIAHRGPDEGGYSILGKGRVGLAHVRLSIIDLKTGQQPLFNEDGTVAISFNGEIYDHADLRERLRAAGHRFRSQSDTEVIVHLYEEYGLDFVDHLNGEFAFVLWDARRNRLVAVRDRAGIKPLFYRTNSDELLLCSEAKGILSLGRVQRRISNDYLMGPLVGVFPAAHSAFETVRAVPPGHLLVVDGEGVHRTRPYFRHRYVADRSMTWDQAKQEVRSRFQRAVVRRMVADVEVGAYLSGGIDSTLVCAAMAEKGVRFKAFNIGFFGSNYDESSIARRIASHYGAEFETFDCSAEMMADALEDTLFHTEQAISDPHSVAKQLLSKLVRARGHKVCITGEGADEIFAGYPHFKMDAIKRMIASGGAERRRAKHLWARFKKMEARSEGQLWTSGYMDQRPDPNDGVFADQAFYVRAKSLERVMPWVFTREICETGFSGNTSRRYAQDLVDTDLTALEPLNVGRRIGLHQLYSYILPVLGDRVEMANSVECRTPFLDRELLEFTDRVPPEWLVNVDELREKYILHEAFRNEVPRFLHTAHKHPFVSPGWGAVLGTQRGRELSREHLSRKRVEEAGIFRPRTVRVLCQLHDRFGLRSARQGLGMILSTQIIHDRFVRSVVSSDPMFPLVERPRPVSSKDRSTSVGA